MSLKIILPCFCFAFVPGIIMSYIAYMRYYIIYLINIVSMNCCSLMKSTSSKKDVIINKILTRLLEQLCIKKNIYIMANKFDNFNTMKN